LRRFRIPIFEATLFTGLLFFACIVFTLGVRIFRPGEQSAVVATAIDYTEVVVWGLAYLVGLAWASYALETAACRIEGKDAYTETPVERRRWNLLDPASRFYGVWPSLLFFLSLLTVALGSIGLILLQSWAASAPTSASGEFSLQDLFVRLGRFLGNHVEAALLKKLSVWSGAFSMLALAAVVAQSRRLRQSLSMLAAYSLLFALLYFLAHLQFLRGGDNEYLLPPGGGSDSVKASSVKVQKVIRKKYVINPYSSIVFAAPPPIDQIDLKLKAETANQYKAGQGDGDLGDGEGDGGGYGGGKAGGKIRFIRLRHADKYWDKNFGVGGDLNLLIDFGARHPKFKDKIAKETESIDIAGLGTFNAKASPPFVYVCGAAGFVPSPADKKILKQYLIERHGMIFGDNQGGVNFHNSFVALMNEVIGVQPVDIPRDDRIHSRPNELPLLPIVVAHGRPGGLCWKIDGPWAVYYPPGALSDAWRDDHAGIRKKEIVEMCYLLGHNIIDYAHREYGRWLRSQQP